MSGEDQEGKEGGREEAWRTYPMKLAMSSSFSC